MNASSFQGGGAEVPVFAAPYAPADEMLAPALLRAADREAGADARIDARARRLVESIRAHAGGLGGIEEFLHAYSLSTKEGLALMVLAEALLRVPDAATADALIEDKLAAGDWSQAEGSGLLVSASAWTLGVTARVIQPGETPDGIVGSLVKRLGLPTVRLATRQAMRLLGSHFVLGQTIEEALDRAGSHREFRYSFDMLGEGARTAADAAHYFDAYSHAIEAIGARAGNAAMPARPGISVKLSALHPRYEAVSRERVLGGTDAAGAGAFSRGQTPRSQPHHRRRGGRPAGTLPRSDRQGRGRSVARRLGRLRPRSAGLSEARHRGDRLVRKRGPRAEPPDDGASGQGRLLGHRGQARAGARACRLSGVHAQTDDRSQLHGLRAPPRRCAAATLPAVRHPQCVDGGEHHRGRRRPRRRLRIPATARHGRSALRVAAVRHAPGGVPGLCAGW